MHVSEETIGIPKDEMNSGGNVTSNEPFLGIVSGMDEISVFIEKGIPNRH